MTEVDERYTRQVRLPEVGASGQARIAEATLSVGQGAAAQVEREYLERAGVRHILTRELELQPFAHAQHFSHAGCREVARGAWLALRELRALLPSFAGQPESGNGSS